jgi:hypothetical protein
MQLAPPSLSIEEIVAVVGRCGGLTGILHQATDVERAALYEAIGVSAVYNPERNQVRLGADPVASTACRRGDLNPHALSGTRPSTSEVSPKASMCVRSRADSRTNFHASAGQSGRIRCANIAKFLAQASTLRGSESA